MNNLKRYKEITGKEFVGNDYSIEKFQDSKAVSNLIKEIEKLEHYKHLYSKVKKQKDDVVVFAKKEKENYLTKACRIADTNNAGLITSAAIYTCDEILRMLGETDD